MVVNPSPVGLLHDMGSAFDTDGTRTRVLCHDLVALSAPSECEWRYGIEHKGGSSEPSKIAKGMDACVSASMASRTCFIFALATGARHPRLRPGSPCYAIWFLTFCCFYCFCAAHHVVSAAAIESQGHSGPSFEGLAGKQQISFCTCLQPRT